DYTPHLDRLWKPTLGIIKFISPGPWVFLPFLSGLGHRQDRQLMDEYFYQLISHRRQTPPPTDETTPDLLTTLVHHTDWDDHLIRDQLITMFIAGHDTSTALLAWTLYLIGCHPQTAHKLHDEIDTVIGSAEPQAHHLPQLKQLDHVIKESLRLYPPIHMGNRMAARDTTLHQCHIPANTRVMYSIYVSQRDANHWDEPHQFCPARFDRQQHKPSTAFSYLPFGGGPRNCIGATFAQIEAKIVLARILQRTKLTLTRPKIRLYMGATLEPRPGVLMSVQSRR
ncbi:MAG TPA: cytochrome P450, partial [Anaerolineae bacterium]|nr:cytochrome P450 [Anaerolineae bacterium]